MIRYFYFFFSIFLFLHIVNSDESIKTISYNPCIEYQSIFNSLNCQYFSSFFANIDVIGGGSFTQQLNVVANPVERILDISDNNIGAVTCPEGVGCTNLIPPIKISFVRSPIPDSPYNILPGAGISFGLAYALTQDTSITKSGLPYVYQIYAQNPGVGNTSCGSYSTTTMIPILSTLSNSQATQPDCGTGPLDNINFLGTCGGSSKAPFPTGWLSDNNGQPLQQCTELCCGGGNTTSIRVRQLAPYCFLFRVNPVPVAVIDLLVQIESPVTGTITVPIYGTVSLQEPIVISQNGIRITINSNVRIPPTALQNKIQNGWIVVCGDDPESALPDESKPVTNIENITWFFQPPEYTPYYKDDTTGVGNVVPPVTNDPHTDFYGESGNDVLNLAFNFMKNINGLTVQQCLSLVDLIPNVPGYDTDHPLTPASIYNLPSYCTMWSEARSGNLGFLPPSSILPDGSSVPFFNWMIKRNIASVSDLNATNGNAYAIFFPSADQIAPYKDQLTNAIQIEVDFAVGEDSNDVTDYGQVNLPVQIVQPDSTRPNIVNREPLTSPNCFFSDPSLVPTNSKTGGGQFVLQLESTVFNNQVQNSDISAPVSNIYVTISCNAVSQSGKNQQTPSIAIVGSNVILVPSIAYGGLSYPLLFNLSATWQNLYSQEAIDNAIIATCSVNVTYNVQKPGLGSFEQDGFRCKVFANYQTSSSNLTPCPWWNLACQNPLYKSWFFWIVIGSGIVLLALAIFAAVKLTMDSRQFQEKENQETQNFLDKEKARAKEIENVQRENLD